mmetsp:Transcript_9191/g.9146  ORF Transcript_9191/g.9146 Transcript_9191/m.9146 type:complete len:302 (+) Transcript_9191:19-924(+)
MQETDKGKRKTVIVGEVVRDGKPLDFSFKNIRNISDIITMEPRSGERLPILHEEPIEEKKEISQHLLPSPRHEAPRVGENEEMEEEIPKQTKQAEPFKPPQPPAIQKILAEHTTSKAAANSHHGHADEHTSAIVKKKKVKNMTTSLVLSYNIIPDLTGLIDIITKVMKNPLSLKWIDLSYNHLTTISKELCELPQLMSLYLHSNYISDMKELLNLQDTTIKSLTLYGNSIDQLPGYRLYTITLLPQLKRLDSVLITKLEIDNSIGFSHKINKRRLPKVENPPVPVVPKDPNAEEEEQKENA